VNGLIISIGRHAAATLRSCTELQVAAVFERSLYLRHGNDFICIGDASIGDGPLNALVSHFDQRPDGVPIGGVVRSADDCLSFSDGTTLIWAAATRWTMPPWPAVSGASPLMAATLDMLFANCPADGLFLQAVSRLLGAELPAATPIQNRAQRALAALAQGLAAGPPTRDAHLHAAVRDLIGLGPGLTPSGDDVLAGALLGLHATGNAALAAQLGAHVAAASIEATSPLSAAFLRCAVDGETSAPLHQALSAALANADWPTALDTLGRIGHTSGWDHLAGFLLALAASQPRPVS
jgi:Protein of unknown function (DUF2877)